MHCCVKDKGVNMIDLKLLREDPEKIIANLEKHDPSFDARRLSELDKHARKIGVEIESLRKEKNELAKKASDGITDQLRTQSIEIGKKLKELEREFVEKEKELENLYLSCPNILQDSVPEGGKEKNKVIKTVGKKPEFSFPVKNHVDIAQALGWIDFESVSKITAPHFALYKGDGVKALYSLMLFMLKNNIAHGFLPILPPYMVNEESLQIAGNFPKFKEDVYSIKGENLYMTPTSEVNLTNMYRNQILPEDQLPLKMTSWTSCFRREAGGYGAAERGLIRIHQFEKVELYSICTPEKSNDELDRMISCAETILAKLGLHYRISLLAAQDCSFPSSKTYDIEVWMPGQKTYFEVSSASNCLDFQARRGKIRYRDKKTSKTCYVNTLNASSLALPRLLVALLETYQQEDGTVKLPDVIFKEGVSW
jgi:seryl-tRNA synthetase